MAFGIESPWGHIILFLRILKDIRNKRLKIMFNTLDVAYFCSSCNNVFDDWFNHAVCFGHPVVGVSQDSCHRSPTLLFWRPSHPTNHADYSGPPVLKGVTEPHQGGYCCLYEYQRRKAMNCWFWGIDFDATAGELKTEQRTGNWKCVNCCCFSKHR